MSDVVNWYKNRGAEFTDEQIKNLEARWPSRIGAANNGIATAQNAVLQYMREHPEMAVPEFSVLKAAGVSIEAAGWQAHAGEVGGIDPLMLDAFDSAHAGNVLDNISDLNDFFDAAKLIDAAGADKIDGLEGNDVIFGDHVYVLEQIQATRAINCKLERGSLKPLAGPKFIEALAASSKTIFKHRNCGWLSWPNKVDVIKSAVIDFVDEQPLGQLFITGDRAYPTQYLACDQVYRLGLPRPETAPIATIFSGAVDTTIRVFGWGAETPAQFPPRYGYESTLATVETGTAKVSTIAGSIEGETETETDTTDIGISRTSAYVYTYVRSIAGGIIQQESAPSPASAIVDVKDGDGVTVSGFVIPNLEGVEITHIRIYRTMTGMESSEYHFLVELPLPVTEYRDTTHDMNLSSEVLQTTTWDSIPDDAKGLILTDNGIYAAFRGNELLISEPNYAYVFPEGYRITVEDEIVALAHADGTIAVLTTGRPYLVTGAEPSAFQVSHLPFEQACVSARSVAMGAGFVMYASPDGLMYFSANNQELYTAQTFTRDQWQELHPETIMGTIHENRYVGFFEGTNQGFIIDMAARDFVRIEFPCDWKVNALYHHSNDDCIYLSIDYKEGDIEKHGVWQFEADKPLP